MSDATADVTVWDWRDGELAPANTGQPVSRAPAAGTVTVADSWLLLNGTVLGLPLHRARFLDGLGGPAAAALNAEQFWNRMTRELPRQGVWFPRVEARSDDRGTRLRCLLRPAPARSTTVSVIIHRGPDPRRVPHRKGPDLERLDTIRQQARRRGADEAVLTTPEGYLVEGASTALLWWRGNAVTLPAEELERIDSVTAKIVLTVATALKVPVRREYCTPDELADTEVWAANALHGLRLVTRWQDGPPLAALPGRLPLWRARLDALRRPVSSA